MVAEETRVAVQAEEAKATEKARVAQAIAADAQKDLDEALPALDAALDSLKSLKKNDVVEVHTSYFLLTSVQNTTMFWSVQLTRRCVCVCLIYTVGAGYAEASSRSEAGYWSCLHPEGYQTQESCWREARREGWWLLGCRKGSSAGSRKISGQSLQVWQGEMKIFYVGNVNVSFFVYRVPSEK